MQQSKEECQFLINLAKPHMAKSTVVDSATGKSTDSRFIFAATASCLCDHIVFACLRGVVPDFQNLCLRVRTSTGMFLKRGRDKTIREIEQRIADFAFIPVGMWFTYFVDKSPKSTILFCVFLLNFL